MIQHPMHDERIMRDGRPAFAWDNEISMYQRRWETLEHREKQCAELMKLLHIAGITSAEKPWIKEINITIHFETMMQRDYTYNPEKYWDVQVKP